MKNIVKAALMGLGRVPFVRSVGLLLMRWVLVTLPLSSSIRELIVWPLATYILGNSYQLVMRLNTGPTMLGTLDNPIGRSILFYGQATGYVHEPHTLQVALWLLKSSGRVIHAGAHIGYHAVHLAQAVQPGGGQVFAFEPVTDHYAQLKRNCELSRLDNLIVEHMALNGVSQKHVQIQIAGSKSGLIQNGLAEAGVIEEVESVSLDDYARQRDLKSVELIFLDVEGSELNVLSGAEKLLNSRPDLILEVNRAGLLEQQQRPDNLYRFLFERGYSIYFIFDDYGTHRYDPKDKTVNLVPVESDDVDFGPTRVKAFNILATCFPEKLSVPGIKLMAQTVRQSRNP
jgi:FkbM family methyltransferase